MKSQVKIEKDKFEDKEKRRIEKRQKHFDKVDQDVEEGKQKTLK